MDISRQNKSASKPRGTTSVSTRETRVTMLSCLTVKPYLLRHFFEKKMVVERNSWAVSKGKEEERKKKIQ